MREVNLRSVDLNLLVALESLLAERHVTRAAVRAAMSQPAMSRALERLRHTFGDPLLVRAGRAMTLTPRAKELADRLPALMTELRGLIAGTEFVPENYRGRIALLTTDYSSLTVLPAVMQRALAQAPGMRVDVLNATGTFLDELRAGTADVALGVIEDAPAGFYRRSVVEDGYSCLMREGHRLAHAPLTLDAFLAERHALISIIDREAGIVDRTLDALGTPPRTVTLRLPHFVASAAIIAATDMLITLPTRLARHLASRQPLVVSEPPLDLPPFTVSLLWHERTHTDPARQWLRQLIADTGRELPPPA